MFISGTVKVWDPRQKDMPVANMEPVEGETKRDCWTVAFGKIQHSTLYWSSKNAAFAASEQLHLSVKHKILCLCNSAM